MVRVCTTAHFALMAGMEPIQAHRNVSLTGPVCRFSARAARIAGRSSLSGVARQEGQSENVTIRPLPLVEHILYAMVLEYGPGAARCQEAGDGVGGPFPRRVPLPA